MKLLGEGEKLRPQGVMLERFGGFDDDGAVASPPFSVGLDPVAAAEGDEQLALPWIGEGVEELLVLLAAAQLGEAGANTLGGSPSVTCAAMLHRRPNRARRV